MAVVRSKESIHRFYAAAIADGADTPEALNAAMSPRCRALIEQTQAAGAASGLDLGYGMGHHTLAMLQAGLRVVAVDQVPPDHLAAAIRARGLDPSHVSIQQGRLEAFAPEEEFGLVIAKDVLHYLSRDHIERILRSLIDLSASANAHHLEVFCDIWRITGQDTPVAIEGEAALRAGECIVLLRQLYRDWDLAITAEPHIERDRSSERPYFSATRVVATARRSPTPAHHQRGKSL